MTAQNNLSPAQFFHGSKYEFKPGDVLRVADAKPPNYSESTGRHLYFTDDTRTAAMYAEPRADSRTEVGHVYQVTPTKQYTLDPAESLGYPRDPSAYRTTRRLVVQRSLGPDDLGQDQWDRLHVNELHPNRTDSGTAHWCDNCTSPTGQGVLDYGKLRGYR